MAEPQLELQCLGRCILGTFTALSDATWDITEDNGFPSKDQISTEHQRFSLWAQSLGLNQVGHASLDYRVRDASVVKASLADLLTELGDHLENLASIIIGGRQPLEQDPGSSHRDQEASSEAALSDDQSSLSSLSSFGSFREADFRLESVSKRLDALYELASRIRSPRNRPQRPVEELYKHVPEKQRADYIKSQKQIEISRVSYVQKQQLELDFPTEQLEKLEISEDQLQEYSSPDYWLIQRTGVANARRKQQFVYWRRHAKLLGRDMTENEIPRLAAPAVVQSPASPVSEPKAILGNCAPSVSMATSATRLDPETPGLGDTVSVISRHSHVSAAVSPNGKDLTWPAAPKHLAGSKHFSCPYCRVLCPQRYLHQNEWQLHQIHDLQPYQCTYEDCTDPDRLYRLRQDWIDHENQHRRVWHCNIHQEEFETQPEYIQHLQDRKDEHTAEDITPEMVAAVVGSSLEPLRDCPFCPTAFPDVPTMQKHVRYHLERLALYTLPDVHEQEGDEMASVQPSDSNRLVENQGRRESITHDFTEEEEQSFLGLFDPPQPRKSLLTTESLGALTKDEQVSLGVPIDAWRPVLLSDNPLTFGWQSDDDSSPKSANDNKGTSPDLESEPLSKTGRDLTKEGVILLMGVAGSGKSYFLNKLKSHGASKVHDLQTATAKYQVVQILLDGEEKQSVTVVETPGFDDTNRPQGEILAEIAEFLGTQYALGMPLRGVLFLHKITENMITGSSLTYLNLLRSLVGEDALKKVVLVTNMWTTLRDEDRSEALRREQELIDKYWDPMQKKGSYVAKFDGTTDSALVLVYQLAGNKNVVLDVQRQIVDQNKSVLGTSAGKDLAQKLERDINDYRVKVSRLETELLGELKARPGNMERIRMLQEDKAQMEELLELAETSMERMKVRPSSSIKQRLNQALKERGGDAAFVLAAVLGMTLTIVQVGFEKPDRRRPFTSSHHCPGARMPARGNCRFSRSRGFCRAHQTECPTHNIIHLQWEPCPSCPVLVSCVYHSDQVFPEMEQCPSCVAEAADPNRCPRKWEGQCDWRDDLGYCTVHQAWCYTHNGPYNLDDSYQCPCYAR